MALGKKVATMPESNENQPCRCFWEEFQVCSALVAEVDEDDGWEWVAVRCGKFGFYFE